MKTTYTARTKTFAAGALIAAAFATVVTSGAAGDRKSVV